MLNVVSCARRVARLAGPALLLAGAAGCGGSVAPAIAGGSAGAALSIRIGNPQPDTTASCAPPSTSRSGEVITAASGAGSVVIERQPFRLSVLDAAGKTVLAEMPNPLGDPAVYAQPSALPGGATPAVHQSSYNPLGFVTGAALGAVYPATPWSGNLLLGITSGIQYTACRVEAIRATADTLDLTVSSNDPLGSTFDIQVSADGPAAFRIQATVNGASAVAAMVDSFQSSSAEAFHGFGGRHNALDQHGQYFYNWIEEENFGAGPLQAAANPIPGTGQSAYLFPNGPTAAYYVQSQFYSSAGYGFLLNQPELSTWSMDSDRSDAWQLAVAASRLDFTVAPGAASQSLATLTAISGRQRVPPAWAIGPQYDRAVQQYGQQTNAYISDIDSDLGSLSRYKLPVSGYRIEGWVRLPADTLAADMARIRALGAHTLFYFRPFVSLVNDGFEQADNASAALSGGYGATDAAGLPYVFVDSFGDPALLLDFTNSTAITWWQGRIRQALDLGADGFMQDFGEETQPDMSFAGAQPGTSEHNRYPLDYHAATRAVLDQYAAAHPGRELFYFTRSGYSGRPGSAASENANFPGDELTDFGRSSGLASLTTDMLNRAVGGAYGYTTDIGGYQDLYTPATGKELLLRWAEWAALSPLFRLHNSGTTGTQMPWDFDQETIDDYRALSQLHLRAAPLILKLWQQAQGDGLPPTRPLWLAYPDDATAAAQDQEWLLGADVLVAPVVVQGVTSREVYLPPGCWTYVPDGSQHAGAASVTVQAPLGTLPYFFHCGTQPF